MNNILVIRFSSLGDVVLTTGVIKYVKESLPDLNIDILTFSSYSDIFNNFPYIRKVYSVEKKCSLSKLVSVINTMPDYDGVFDLHDNLRSRFAKIIIPAKSYTYNKNSLARRFYVKYRIACGFLNKHVTEKYCSLFSKVLNIPVPSLEELRPYIVNPFADKKNTDKIVCINPFASKKGKEWPFMNETAKLLIDAGLKVRYIGSGNINVPNGVEDRRGLLPISELISNIAECCLLITTDSGPMHIATALNIPVAAIFGPTSKELGFYPDFKNCSVIEDNSIKCRPCHIHGPEECPKGHFQCMFSATIEEVRVKALNMIK